MAEEFYCEDCDEKRLVASSFAGSCNDKTCIRRNLCDSCVIVCEGCGLDFCSHHASNVAEDGEEDKFLCRKCEDEGK